MWTDDRIVDAEDDGAIVIRHDARDLPLEDGTVDLIITSPPYFALRSYRDDGEHYDGQIGSEDTPALFLAALDECMVEWGRVLKPSGSVWVNLGDKYAGTGGANSNTGLGLEDGDEEAHDNRGSARNNTKQTRGYRAKSLLGLPWRFAIRQIDAGWILRAEVVWSKPNGLPESVTDRVRRSHEQWFHFVKEPRYFSGVDEIREDFKGSGEGESWEQWSAAGSSGSNRGVNTGPRTTMLPEGGDLAGNPLGRLPGSVWTIPSEPLLIPDETRELLDLPDHFAAFPQEFPRRIITGWSPVGVCSECGEGRRPVVTDLTPQPPSIRLGELTRARTTTATGTVGEPSLGVSAIDKTTTITGYACACPTPDAPTTPAVILDPFGGTGTVAGVARMLGRYGISNDLSESYNRLAAWRIWQSSHFTKTEQRAWAERQGTML